MKKFYLVMLAALLGANQTWAAWEGSGNGEQHNGEWYVVWQDSYEELNTIETGPTINLLGPGAKLSYEAKRTFAGVNNFYYSYSSDGGDSWTDIAQDLTTSYKEYSADLSSDVNAIRFLTKVGATLNKQIKNIRVKMAQYIETPSKTGIDFGKAELGDADKTQTFTVAWCNVPAMTVELTGDDKARFSVEITNNAAAGKYGTATFTVKYNHDVIGSHSANVVIRDSYGNYVKTVSLEGETKKHDNTIVWDVAEGWKDWSETIELNATSDNAESDIVYTINKPELVAVEGNVLTFLEAGAGQEVKITASQAATASYNAAASVSKTFSIKRQQEIIWDAEKVNTSMRLGATRDIKEYASAKNETEKTIVFTSANPAIISVEGTLLTANALSEEGVEIIASIEGDEQNRPAVSSKIFVVKDKESVVVTQGGAIIEQNGELKLHLGEQTGVIASNNTAIPVEISIDDESVARYNESTKCIEAVALGETTLRLVQAGTEDFNEYESNVTLKVVREANTLELTAEAYEQFVGDQIENIIVAESLNSDAPISVESSDETIAYYDEESKVVLIPNSEAKSFEEKEIVLTVRQEETDIIAAAEKTITLTVKKYANAIKVNGEAEFATTINAASSLSVIFTSENEETEFEVEQLSGANIAAYAEGEVAASYRTGTATWAVRQAESYKYLAAENTFSVKVAQEAETEDCYIVDEADEQSWSTISESKAYAFSADVPGKTLYVEARRTGILGVSNNNYFYAQYSADGDNWIDLFKLDVPETDNWYEQEHALPEEARFVRFITKTGATGNRFIRNVKVSRKGYIKAEAEAIVTGVEEEGFSTLKVEYSIANGGDLKIVSDNPKFAFGAERAPVYTISGVECSNGVAVIDVFYYSDEIGADEANIVIFNGVYVENVQITARAKGVPEILVYPTASVVVYDAPLGTSELTGGEASVEGTFAWEDPELIPEIGKDFYSVIFTPLDTENYVSVPLMVEVQVDEAPTGVENVEEGTKAVKILRNGQIFILRDGKVYNLSGARVE